MRDRTVNGLLWVVGVILLFLFPLQIVNAALLAQSSITKREDKRAGWNTSASTVSTRIQRILAPSAEIAGGWKGLPMKVYTEEDLAKRDVTFRDVRWLKMKTTDTPVELPPFASLAEWQKWAQDLRQRILVSAGLWPALPKTPLNAHIFGRIEHPDYSVEKVYFESLPGFFVTGNLYRPRGKAGPFPAILSPHGHWKNGRLENSEKASVPGRCIQFARMGAVVFSPDMIGYVDSRQISHRFASDRFSQVWGISLLGLQLWDNIRALDFLESLPDVDSTRLGCTGASGGGTQTFLLTAVDPRVKVAAPVNMVSAHFQGGCLCENAPGLRLEEASNVAFAALAAPRPLLLVSDTHDWTKNTPWTEYPMIRRVYHLFGAEDHINYVQFDFPHNYNKPSREAVYTWFNRWLFKKARGEKVTEDPFQVEPQKDLHVFPNGNPPGHLDEDRLKTLWRKWVLRQLRELWPQDKAGWAHFRDIYGTAYRHVLAAQVPAHVVSRKVGSVRKEGLRVDKLLISREGQLDWTPALYLQLDQANSAGVLVISGKGKSALFEPGTARIKSWVLRLLKSGHSVLAIDPFAVGEHKLLPGTKTQRQRQFKFFTTFNRTVTQEQVQDVLTALAFFRKNLRRSSVCLLGMDQGGAIALLAAGLSEKFQKILIDAQFLRANQDSVLLKYFVPGLGRIGGFTTAAALASPQKLTLFCPLRPPWFNVKRVAEIYRILNEKQSFRFIPHRIRLTEALKNWP